MPFAGCQDVAKTIIVTDVRKTMIVTATVIEIEIEEIGIGKETRI